jgi:hypothetical protein
MSLGYIGICQKHTEDDTAVIYTYSGENWNDGGKSKHGDRYLQDGIIFIDKTKLKLEWPQNLPNKSIYLDRECKNAFRRNNIAIDYIAWRLLCKIFKTLQSESHFPEQEAFIQ